jgi:hypothetical protein
LWVAGTDNFYGASEGLSPEYDNALNQHEMPAVDAQEQLMREQEWRAELAKVSCGFLKMLCITMHLV